MQLCVLFARELRMTPEQTLGMDAQLTDHLLMELERQHSEREAEQRRASRRR